MKLAVIPARGGSKRIPYKNIKLFCGKPIIAWSIEAAKKTNLFDRIIVSTDNKEVAKIAAQWGGDVPFLRPEELADDFTDTASVVAHAIGWLENKGYSFNSVCCIYATAPFIQPSEIISGNTILETKDVEFVFSATSYAFPIQRAFKLSNDGKIEMFDEKKFQLRSQDLDDSFHDAGQFYWGKPNSWNSGTKIFTPSSEVVVLPRHRVQDIDTQEDWQRAELMFEVLKKYEDII